MIRFVTTCHKAGFKSYGHRLAKKANFLPGELIWYTEGYEVPGVKCVDNSTLANLQEFKDRHRNFVSPGFYRDVVRFCHKIFAVYDALIDHDDLGVWIDADVVPLMSMPEEYVRSQLPEGFYISLFKRLNLHSECGYWVVDCRHEGHKRFMDAILSMYTKDKYKKEREWHDSYLMDVVISGLESAGVIRSHNLGLECSQPHVMAVSDIAKYLDHTKGERKRKGYSPENRNVKR